MFSVNPLETAPTPAEPVSQPTNLLVTFLEYSSIIIQDTKGEFYICKAVNCIYRILKLFLKRNAAVSGTSFIKV